MGTAIFTDDVTTKSQANFRKLLAADGTDGSSNKGHACWGVMIQYTGAAWECIANYGAEEQISNVGLTWDGVNDWLQIDISGCSNTFSNYPVVSITPGLGDAYYLTKGAAITASLTRVRFYNITDGTLIGTESANMRFSIMWFGEI